MENKLPDSGGAKCRIMGKEHKTKQNIYPYSERWIFLSFKAVKEMKMKRLAVEGCPNLKYLSKREKIMELK